LSGAPKPAGPGAAVRIRWDTSEAEAALALLEKRAAATEEDWRRLFDSEGFKRLEAREEWLGKTLGTPRRVDREAFHAWLESPATREQRGALADTLERWRRADLESLSRQVQAFLPPGSPQTFTLSPVIKPQDNTFVFTPEGQEPAIILYLDPSISQAEFESIAAHEAHHIGLAGHRDPVEQAAIARQPQPVQDVCQWLGAFGEGFAMLAAAGSTEVHPHAASKPEERERWDRDMALFAQHLRQLDAFFMDILEGRLEGEALRRKAFEFYGPEQGPWYTVGYQMAVLVERQLGRERLLRCMAQPRLLLAAYEEAAQRQQGDWPRWNPVLLERLAFR
jgi:hypothetical protein